MNQYIPLAWLKQCRYQIKQVVQHDKISNSGIKITILGYASNEFHSFDRILERLPTIEQADDALGGGSIMPSINNLYSKNILAYDVSPKTIIVKG